MDEVRVVRVDNGKDITGGKWMKPMLKLCPRLCIIIIIEII